MPKSYQTLFALATLLVSDVAGFRFTYPEHGVDNYVFRDGDTVIVNWEPQILLPEIYLSCGPKASVLAQTNDNNVETQVAFKSVYPGQPFRVNWIPQGNDNTYCTFCAGINQQTCSGIFRLEESTPGVSPKVWHAQQHLTKTHSGHHSPTGTGHHSRTGTGAAQPSSAFPSSATGASAAASSGTGSGSSPTTLAGSPAPYSNSSTAAVPTTILSSAAASSSSSSSDPPSETDSALSVFPDGSAPTGAAASSSTYSAAASTTIVASYVNPTDPSNTSPTGSFNPPPSNLTAPSVPQNPPQADTTPSALLQRHSGASSLMEYMSLATIGVSVVTALVLFTL